MSIDLIFNELSLAPSASDKYSVEARMSDFVLTLRSARRQGITGALRVPMTFSSAPLAPGYSLYDWTNDSEVSREERLFVKTLVTKSPFLFESTWTEEMALAYDFKIDSQQVFGCGIAYLLEGLSVSLRSESRWDTHLLELTVEQLDENDIHIKTEEIVHASLPAHILTHTEWIKSRLAKDVNSGDDLWERRAELFPSLTFCNAVEKQMRELDYGTATLMLQPVVSVLFALEAFCKLWTEGPFDPRGLLLTASPESPITLKKYGNERTFLCPDGVEREFSWHVKMNYKAWRIHFHFDQAKPSTLLIGYIGEHLRIVSGKP